MKSIRSTGSGKTLTSFKTARLASRLDEIDKVLFVVDRKDLDYQTMKEYDRFEKGAANGINYRIAMELVTKSALGSCELDVAYCSGIVGKYRLMPESSSPPFRSFPISSPAIRNIRFTVSMPPSRLPYVLALVEVFMRSRISSVAAIWYGRITNKRFSDVNTQYLVRMFRSVCFEKNV